MPVESLQGTENCLDRKIKAELVLPPVEKAVSERQSARDGSVRRTRGGYRVVAGSIPKRGAVIDSLRHRGQRLGLVIRLRSVNSNPQPWQEEGSSRNRRVLSRPTVLIT